MMSVGVRTLKNQTSRLLRRVAAGNPLVVTDRHRAVALLVPTGSPRPDIAARLRFLRAAGRITWSGGKPRGLLRGPVVRGRPVSDAVIEDRR